MVVQSLTGKEEGVANVRRDAPAVEVVARSEEDADADAEARALVADNMVGAASSVCMRVQTGGQVSAGEQRREIR